MFIVILGAGKIGSYVAKILSEEKHDVVLIDRDERALARASRESDVAQIHAKAPNVKLFKNLLEKKPDLFFAATSDEETNLVACSIAKNLGFPKTVARVQSRDYFNDAHLDFGRLFYVDYFIGPEILAAQDLAKILVHSRDLAAMHFAHGNIHMRTIQIPDWWDKGNIPIAKLSLPNDLIAALIRRKDGEEETILIPNGQDHILPGDQLTVLGETKVMHRLDEIFSSPESTIRSVILVGGSSIAVQLAHILLQQKINVRIIEKEIQRCHLLAQILPDATIINRDGRDPDLLRSERVQDADAFVSCTHFDETNFMIASLAKAIGSPKSIAQLTNGQLVPLLEKMDVIAALSPRVNVANRILSILDEETTLTVGSLCFDSAKIIEMRVAPSSEIIGIPLSDLKLPKGLLIAVIERQGRVMIGRGNRVLCSDDTVIAICNPAQIPILQELFH